MNYEANIPRGRISTSTEFAIPFRARSSSHNLHCNCTDPDHQYAFVSPSVASADTNTMASEDPKAKSTEYFPSLPDIKAEDEHSIISENIMEDTDAHSISEDDESVSSPNTRKSKRNDASSSPTGAEPETGHTHPASHPASSFSRLFAYGLVGMTVDYNGDILEAGSKKSWGKASGDITEMIGQKIDEDGLIRSSSGNGEVVGQIAQNYGLQEAVAAMLEAQKNMGMGMGGTKSPTNGNGNGQRFGSGAKWTPDTEHAENQTKGKNGENGEQEKSQELPNIWGGTVGDAAPGNDIHLNVQSTKEGISMSIRIPTMFMKEQQRQFEEERQEKQERQERNGSAKERS